MAFDKKHLRYCILFAFLLKKNATEATATICSALREGAVTHKTYKKWFQRFRNLDFDLSDRERPVQPKKFENEELDQLLEENPTKMEKEFAHFFGITQQALSHRLHRLERIQKAGWGPKAPN